MTTETKQIFEFAEFRVDLSEKTLLKNDVPVRLTPKAIDTLAFLVQNAGRLLEKEELMREIWQDRFVEEGNLAFNIKVLRKALGDDAANPRFIETVPRRGYRFIADVRRKAAGNGDHSVPIESGLLADQTKRGEYEAALNADEAGIERPDSNFPTTPDSGMIESGHNAKRLVWAAATGILVLAVLGFGVYRLFLSSASPTGARLTSGERLTANGNVALAALSPDGRFIAYTAGEVGKQGFWVKNIATGSETQLTLAAEHTSFNSLSFSPDGNSIYYGSKGMLFVVPILGGTPTKVLSDYGGEIAFAPDGTKFAYIAYPPENRETAVLVISDMNGTERRTLAVSSRPNLFLRSAAWSPTGDVIVCAALNAQGHQEIVAVRITDGSTSRLATPKWNTVVRVVWNTDGRELLVVAEESGDLLNQVWSVSFPQGEARRLTNDSYNYQSVAVAADGRLITAVRAEQAAHLWLMPSGDRQKMRQITSGFEKYDGVFSLNWTPNGKIVFANAPSGRPALWQSNEDGSDPRRIAGDVGGGVLTPDGRFSVFQNADESGTGLFKLSLDDGTRSRLTTGTDDHPAISPDGRSVVFTRFDQDVALWKVSLEGGEPRKLTSFTGYPTASVFSPDGTMIAFYRGVSSSTSPPTIAVVSSEGGEILKEYSVPVQFSRNWFARTAIQWSGDGRSLYFLSMRDKTSNIFRQPIDGGPPTQVTDFTDGLIFNFAFSPDGSKLLLSRGTFNRDVVLLTKAD